MKQQRGLRYQAVIVDNASGQATQEILAQASAVIVRSDVNLGGAGGFALGIQHALELGVDWLWLMDDDAIPEAGALEELASQLPHLPANAAVACSRVMEFGDIATTHRRRFNMLLGYERPVPSGAYTASVVAVDTASFVGFMVSAAAVRAVGLPRTEFFVSYDDTEYSLRLKKHGYSLWLMPASGIVHKRKKQERLRSTEFGPRHYFNVRNRIVVKRAYCKAGYAGAGLGALFGLGLWLCTPGRFRPRPWRMVLCAIKDGFSGRLGPLPEHFTSRPAP
ncbi:candidate b-glycosyltransferase, Glycosyltransferase Family 2 [Ramlibacter tataouinensis TTB310]|uniref:Candidate b-glycosyltransferase, Glycosyltransferase Family 2 n=1 Tax=Ramlibacter tataouinensis (strain ATCC BAA-407 / DSM 14655 / LMG 21543 / TTB310) TaxID=365046 RepID=F5XYY4_RAMTT|nr:candidate b-glycosyltransferase, Glycosyltransferase Family 2 [Ramlibacter tataouinensis TTB310]